jgi:glucose/arabinose dehydrogenase
MKDLYLLFILFSSVTLPAQDFTRSQLPAQLDTPWEIQYGPDGMLWITEAGGTISRVHPVSGEKTVVYTAPDFYEGSALEQNPLCFMPNIGSGTLGLALHPDFLNPATPYLYFMYSYNAGNEADPQTLWKVARLTWDWKSESVESKTDIITGISNGYDHWGGRLIAITREGTPYLFLSVGDHGISERNSPDCYINQDDNPNNFAQDVSTDNGKIHRYNMDGSIPADNPIPGNSFYTRGHRNPQGLMYIPQHDLLFDVEHGDRTDDEVNLLEAGMNYGWKWVRGYHNDNNFPGEAQFIASYTPHPMIAGDRLVEAFYSFCAVDQPETDEYLDWCTPAPSDGIYYNLDAIPQWKNSLLVVSLKNGSVTDNQVHVLRLTEDGRGMMPSTPEAPNPQAFFGEDQHLNGRLRDVTFSPDGSKIYLINNNEAEITEKITVYSVTTTAIESEADANATLRFYPNPVSNILTLESAEAITQLNIYTLSGEQVMIGNQSLTQIDISHLSEGMYMAKVITMSGDLITRKFVKQ